MSGGHAEMEPEGHTPNKRRLVCPADASESCAVQKEKCSSGPAAASSSSSRVLAGIRDAAAYVAEKDTTDALDCGVCFLPLKPPIFQCEVGHAVCAPCRAKLEAAGKCHVCGASTAGGYRRCHAMERLVESVRVPCPNAAHGCTATPAYYDQHGHRKACAHAPCHCPGEACGFIGSTAALFDHFSSVHGWPCTTFERDGRRKDFRCQSLQQLRRQLFDGHFKIRLHEGFNFLLVIHSTDQGTTTRNKFLFLLNMARQPVGRAISVHWIHPEAAESDGRGHSSMECSLVYSSSQFMECPYTHRIYCDLRSEFRVACTDLSRGLQNIVSCYQLVVTDYVVADSDKDAIQVTASFDTRWEKTVTAQLNLTSANRSG